MSGFNRGPWELAGPAGYGDLPGHRVKEPSGYVLAVAIADVPELKAEANARLIAAAPDLLEALGAIYADCHDQATPTIREMCRAAIARATGEAG